MKQHKNDLKPGPLTESGYSGTSCTQANLPDNNRAPVEPPVEGHQRLKSIQRRGSPGIEQVKADGDSRIGLKLRTKAQTGDPGIIHLYPQVKSPGFLHCLHVTGFRRRTISLQTDPEKTEMVVLYPISGKEIPNDRIVDIFSDKALRPPGRNIFSFGRLLTHRTRKVKSRLMSCFRWRKTMNLPELVFSLKKLESLWRETKSLPYWVISLIKMEFTLEAKYRIFEASKLRLCQS